MQPDEIWLASFPFGDVPGMKIRPVLLLTAPMGRFSEILAAYISSVIPPDVLASDLVIDPASGTNAVTGLKTQSVVRLHKLATIPSSHVLRRLVRLSSEAAITIDVKIR